MVEYSYFSEATMNLMVDRLENEDSDIMEVGDYIDNIILDRHLERDDRKAAWSEIMAQYIKSPPSKSKTISQMVD